MRFVASAAAEFLPVCACMLLSLHLPCTARDDSLPSRSSSTDPRRECATSALESRRSSLKQRCGAVRVEQRDLRVRLMQVWNASDLPKKSLVGPVAGWPRRTRARVVLA